MTRVLVAVGLLAALSAQPGWAQRADNCVSSAMNNPEATYPCVTAHEWLSWRRAFNDFAPRLFK